MIGYLIAAAGIILGALYELGRKQGEKEPKKEGKKDEQPHQ